MSKRKNMKKNPEKKERSLSLKDDLQDYGLVTKKLGSGNFGVKLSLEDREVIARVRGKFRYKGAKKANWVEPGTVVLVAFRDYDEKLVDIVEVYTAPEVRQLRKSGEINFDADEVIMEDIETVMEEEAEERQKIEDLIAGI